MDHGKKKYTILAIYFQALCGVVSGFKYASSSNLRSVHVGSGVVNQSRLQGLTTVHTNASPHRTKGCDSTLAPQP